MPKAATLPEPTATQEEPTRARPTDDEGRALDEWGLPLSGPARIRALAGRIDPRVDTAGWTETPEEPLAIEDVPLPDDPAAEPAPTATPPADVPPSTES